eukprot:scaffold337999_cov22-Prasinocladus_malaysianus.AAC.1
MTDRLPQCDGLCDHRDAGRFLYHAKVHGTSLLVAFLCLCVSDNLAHDRAAVLCICGVRRLVDKLGQAKH